MNLFVYDDLKNYTLDTLSNKRRRIVMQALRSFTARTIPDPEEFKVTAYDVYLSFQKVPGTPVKTNGAKRKFFQDGRGLFTGIK